VCERASSWQRRTCHVEMDSLGLLLLLPFFDSLSFSPVHPNRFSTLSFLTASQQPLHRRCSPRRRNTLLTVSSRTLGRGRSGQPSITADSSEQQRQTNLPRNDIRRVAAATMDDDHLWFLHFLHRTISPPGVSYVQESPIRSGSRKATRDLECSGASPETDDPGLSLCVYL